MDHKHRGAPRGNLNALKHGYYSRAFRQLERADLDNLDETLKSEINALRVIGRRIMAELKSSNISQETLLTYIDTMLKITLSIARIYNTQSIVETRRREEQNPLTNILKELTHELTQNASTLTDQE
jgi:ribosomal 50S subunit-associated protein YjgA (DUF615 family)